MQHDALAHFRPLDPGRIDLIDPVELQYWCRELHCTRDELMRAVARVGDHITAVRDCLAAGR